MFTFHIGYAGRMLPVPMQEYYITNPTRTCTHQDQYLNLHLASVLRFAKISLVELTQSKGVGNINEVTNDVGKLLKIPMVSFKSHCPVMYKWTISGITIII